MTDNVVNFPVAKRMTPPEVEKLMGWKNETRQMTHAEVKSMVLFALQAMNEVDSFPDINDEVGLPIKSPSYGWVDAFLATFEEKLKLEAEVDV